MNLCRIITLKNDRTIGHTMSTTEEIECGPKDLILAGPFLWSHASYRMVAQKDRGILENNFLLDDDVCFSFTLVIIDDLEKKPLFLNKSQSHALLLLGEMIEGIFEITTLSNIRLIALEPDCTSSRLSMNFIVSRRTSSHVMVGACMCMMAALDAMLFVRGLKALNPELKIASLSFNDGETIEIIKSVMTTII